MMLRPLYLTRVLCFPLFILFHSATAQTDPPLFSSPQTQTILHHALPPQLGENEFNRLLRGLKESLEEVEKIYKHKLDPAGIRDLYDGGVAGAFMEGMIFDFPGLGGGLNRAQDRSDKDYNESIQPFITERLFGQRSALGAYFYSIREACNSDIACIEEAAGLVSEDPRIVALLGQHPDLIDQAKLKELIAATAANAEEQHEQTLEEFTNQQQLIAEMASSLYGQLGQIIGNQEAQARNIASIIQTQQEHTIALTQIMEAINENQEELRQRLEQGFGAITELQNYNIFLTELVLAHTWVIDKKIDAIDRRIDTVLIQLGEISEDVNIIRERQLSQIFNESPLLTKLRMLEGPEGREMIKDENERLAMIERMKVMIQQEQIIAVTKKVREWGIVSLEALNTFYPNCPPEIKRAVGIAITASDIIGSITSGNWSQAILSGLSLFRTPRPGPEMQMLQQITTQLTNLESNMNAQFRGVHEHLFAMEENLTARLEIIDQKLDIISQQILFTYTELSEQLLTADNKLSYVIQQNDCTEDLVLDIFRSNNIDICEGPVRIFKERMAQGQINSLADLDKFFIGQQCKNCVEALFNSSNQNLLNSQVFRYSYCNTGSATNNNRPDNIYDFIFNRLLDDDIRNSPLGIFSILYLPTNVNTAASLIDSLRALPDSLKERISSAYAQFAITDSDRHYRHYMAALEMVDYVLTMMPFLELYNDGGLLTSEQLAARPEITRERSRKIIAFLDNLSDLIDHTIFQQALMTGLSSFKAIDRALLTGDDTDISGMNLTDLLRYNPLFNKNYSAYFLEKNHGGIKNLDRIVRRDPFRSAGKYYQGNNSYELLIMRDEYGNQFLSTNWSTALGKKTIFQNYIPGLTGGAADSLIYYNNLSSAIPRSIPALLSAKRRVNSLSSEMRFIISDALDRPDGPLTRSELSTMLFFNKKN
ncbi:MAG TPA: hypothetical protein PK339_12725 [Flavitalea sp.]|nr:hypothetical protein [Flavitalea sp.]